MKSGINQTTIGNLKTGENQRSNKPNTEVCVCIHAKTRINEYLAFSLGLISTQEDCWFKGSDGIGEQDAMHKLD